jgi:hypothetical protein
MPFILIAHGKTGGSTISSSDTTPRSLLKQTFCYYLVLLLWPAYLFVLPAVFWHAGGWAILFVIFPGLYLFTWAGYLMHESWHKYVPHVSHRFFFHVFGLLLLMDPQIYQISHGYHHSQVHTYADLEFHPLGEIKSRGARIFHNGLEFLIGVGFLVAMAAWSIPRDPRVAKKYRFWQLPVATLAWVALFGGLGCLSHAFFHVTYWQAGVSYVVMLWVGSFFLHQSQLVEHGNLILEGSLPQRNMGTRNLKPDGLLEKGFLFMTHNDSREHVLHHTAVTVHSRPFPGVFPLPEGTIKITLREYLRIAGRMLKGEDPGRM